MSGLLRTVLAKYRADASSERAKGSKFERLMQAFLLTDPIQKNRFNTVWLWNDFPGRKSLGGVDVGIDLVALNHEDGEYCAIQCKCCRDDAYIEKADVDGFLATSARSFTINGVVHKFSSRLWIATTDRWSSNARESIRNQDPPVNKLDLSHLESLSIDWKALDEGISGVSARGPIKELRPHQTIALEKTRAYFKDRDRGKLIMACGTGKTINSLRIAEDATGGRGLVLFLTPSIALLNQTLTEWSYNAREELYAICVCSDATASQVKKHKTEDFANDSIEELAAPASTDVENFVKRLKNRKGKAPGMTVVFSTYQSIDVIHRAQEERPDFVFDLIVCDEAHRTTGVSLADTNDSAFIRVHYNDYIKASKRLYMTATPRLYGDDAKGKAQAMAATLCSMDDEALYGKEIHRMGFGAAVEAGLLSDYKVLVLTLKRSDVPVELQESLTKNGEIDLDDAAKLIGCVNALSKNLVGGETIVNGSDPTPMRRALAFCSTIKISKSITSAFNQIGERYADLLPDNLSATIQNIKSDHVDGTMSAGERGGRLDWLKESDDEKECRILTNVRCLSEGVDVPSLDAALFLSPRSSQIDVVQSVGRVMRRSADKQYGYIIIPVVFPDDTDPVKALDDNKRYRVVWDVCNALRAHDDRFEAVVNQLELNHKKPDNLLAGSVCDRGNAAHDDAVPSQEAKRIAEQLNLRFEAMQSAVYAKLVQKVGSRTYWETWATSVGKVAQRQIERLTRLTEESPEHRAAFEEFVEGLRKNVNPSVNKSEAIEMLAQHIVTGPVFDALFRDYSFLENNPVSRSMRKILDLLEENASSEELKELEGFYASVKRRVEGIDNAEGRQRIIIELYDKFFKTAFPKLVEKLGIVYTPVEAVDFTLRSVDEALRREFGLALTDENVHILDPFTGTGTFVTRLLQLGLIKPEDMDRKYRSELHANEIVPLAYYIAAVNIESAYHDLCGGEYRPFGGICLTDTFQLGENEDKEEKVREFAECMPENSDRVERQRLALLRVIIGNPPYSVGQKSGNDDAQNRSYPKLEARIRDTYAKLSVAGLKKSLYDSYVKAFRRATDLLGDEGGIIAYVTNANWLNNNAMAGIRKSLEQEFSAIYVFNLRGDQRTSGELSRQEGGKLFGAGSRTPIAITLLIKKPGHVAGTDKAAIYYKAVDDYLTREAKLRALDTAGSFAGLELTRLESDEHGDWLTKRSAVFNRYTPLAPDKKYDTATRGVFVTASSGVKTNRDAWTYNFSRPGLEENMRAMITEYEAQRAAGAGVTNRDSAKIAWTDNLRAKLAAGKALVFDPQNIVVSLYRPFNKQSFYLNRDLNWSAYQIPRLFPAPAHKNLVISMVGVGTNRDFSVLMSDSVVNFHTLDTGVVFPLYYYEAATTASGDMFVAGPVRRDAVSDHILAEARSRYRNAAITKEDIFYYVYGFLHSPDYRSLYANNLKKDPPHLPLVALVDDFWAFSRAGRELAALHVDYENVTPHPDVVVSGAESGDFLVDKMRFPPKTDKSVIRYNARILVENIPLKAYDYVVNGRSAIEWVMERYRVTTHTESGIVNDPNAWAVEHDNPRYTLDLLLSVINLSVQTVDIVNDLPKFVEKR